MRLTYLWISPLIAFVLTLLYLPETIGTKILIGIAFAILAFLIHALFQSFYQTIIQPMFKTKVGFLKGEKTFIGTILRLAAKMAMADGKVEEAELRIIKLRLAKEFSAETANAYFSFFKKYLKEDYSLKKLCITINEEFDDSLKSHLVYLLMSIANTDGILKKEEIELLNKIARFANIKRATIISMFNMFEFKYQKTKQKKTSKQKYHNRTKAPKTSQLENAYLILELKKGATATQIKTAYRKLAKIHHPDKIAHLGEEHILKAKEKFQIILEAYELIKNRIGMNNR